MKIKSVDELLNIQLQMLYSVEDQLVKAIPVLAELATDEKLKKSLEEHLEVTEKQRARLEEIGKDKDIILGGVQDQALMYILKSGQTLVQQITDLQVKDDAIMAGTDKVEHYEIAAYQAAISVAKKADRDDIVDILQETLGEEKKAATMVEAMASGGLVDKIKQAIS